MGFEITADVRGNAFVTIAVVFLIATIGIVLILSVKEEKIGREVFLDPPLDAIDNHYDLPTTEEAIGFDLDNCNPSTSACVRHTNVDGNGNFIEGGCGLTVTFFEIDGDTGERIPGTEYVTDLDMNENGIPEVEITDPATGYNFHRDILCLPDYGAPPPVNPTSEDGSVSVTCSCQTTCNGPLIDPSNGVETSQLVCLSSATHPQFCNKRSVVDEDGYVAEVEAFCNPNSDYNPEDLRPDDEIPIGESQSCGCFTLEELGYGDDDTPNPKAAMPEFVPPDFEHIVAYENGAHTFNVKNLNPNVPIKFYKFELIDDNELRYPLNDFIYHPSDLTGVNDPLTGSDGLLHVDIDLYDALTTLSLPDGPYDIIVTFFQDDQTENPDQNEGKKKIEIERRDREESIYCGCESLEIRYQNKIHPANSPLPQIGSSGSPSLFLNPDLRVLPRSELKHLLSSRAKKKAIGFRYGIRGDAPVPTSSIVINTPSTGQRQEFSANPNALIGHTFEMKAKITTEEEWDSDCSFYTAQIAKGRRIIKSDFSRNGVVEVTHVGVTKPKRADNGEEMPHPIPGVRAAFDSVERTNYEGDSAERGQPEWKSDGYNRPGIVEIINRDNYDGEIIAHWDDTPALIYDPAYVTYADLDDEFIVRVGPGGNPDIRLDSRHAWVDRSEDPSNQIPDYADRPGEDEGICQCAFSLKSTYTNTPNTYPLPGSNLIPDLTTILSGGTSDTKLTYKPYLSRNCFPVTA
jgi:hypothetical protein